MDISITWADVEAIAPELADVEVVTQNAILLQVDGQMNSDVWGSKLDMGAVWLAAHLATVGPGRSGVAGPVIAESVGQVSRQYAASVAAGAGQLGSTSYGMEYERLLMTVPAARLALAGC